MSRHIFTGKQPNTRVIVGWDAPLETFFLQVIDETKEAEIDALLEKQGAASGETEITVDDENRLCELEASYVSVWLGVMPFEIPTIDRFTEAAAPYVDLPREAFITLFSDRYNRTMNTEKDWRE